MVKSSYLYSYIGFNFFLIRKIATIEIIIYVPDTKDICSIDKPLSIRMPNKAVPKAVANTIRAVVSALIEPMNFTP